MASPFLALASGFSEGVGQGAVQGAEIGYRRAAMALEQQRANLESVNAVGQAIKIPDPAMRTLALNKILPSIGIDTTTQNGKDLVTALGKSTQDTLNYLSDSFTQLGLKIPANVLGQAYSADPGSLISMMFQMRRLGAAANIAGGSDTGQPPTAGATPTDQTQQQTQPAQGQTQPSADTTGATDTTQSAGPSNNGTDQTQPAATGATATNVVPIKPAAEQPVVDPNHPLLQKGGVPAATVSTTGTMPQGMTRLDANPQALWDPQSDPVVQGLQRKIMAERGLGDVGAGYADTLQKKLDLYVSQKNTNISNAIRLTELKISQGQLNVAQGNLWLAGQRLNWDMHGPKSPLGQLLWDQKNGYFGTTGAISSASAGAGGEASATGAGVTSAIATTGTGTPKVNADGTVTVTDAAVLRAMGVKADQELRVNTSTGQTQIINKTTTQMETPSQLGDVQGALDNATRGRQFVSALQEEFAKNPQNFGSAGWARGLVQRVMSLGEDYAKIVPGIRSMVPNNLWPKGYFDPRLPQITQVEHLLSAIVAADMWRGNQGAMGGFSEILKKAEDSTDITGPEMDSKTAAAKLDMLGSYFDSSIKTLNGQRGQGAGSNVPENSAPIKGTNPTPDDIDFLKKNFNSKGIILGTSMNGPGLIAAFDKAYGTQANPHPSQQYIKGQ